MRNALWIFVGGGVGSVARWWFSGWIANLIGQTFPWGTLVINVTGSFVIGLFVTITGPDGRWLARDSFRQFFMYGFAADTRRFLRSACRRLRLRKRANGSKQGQIASYRWCCV
jgi:CrcB protein